MIDSVRETVRQIHVAIHNDLLEEGRRFKYRARLELEVSVGSHCKEPRRNSSGSEYTLCSDLGLNNTLIRIRALWRKCCFWVEVGENTVALENIAVPNSQRPSGYDRCMNKNHENHWKGLQVIKIQTT